MDGRFSAWSPWTPCTHTDGSAVGTCLCRSRSCDSPAPRCGGWQCEGPRMEIANCSRCVAPNTGHMFVCEPRLAGAVRASSPNTHCPRSSGRQKAQGHPAPHARALGKANVRSEGDYKSNPFLVRRGYILRMLQCHWLVWRVQPSSGVRGLILLHEQAQSMCVHG